MDEIDEQVRQRMGYDTVVACREVDSEHPIHVALRGPTEDEPRWTTSFHIGCDPDIPEVGTSRVQAHETESQAREDYARISDYRFFAEEPPHADDDQPYIPGPFV